jgi:hypothetical protein
MAFMGLMGFFILVMGIFAGIIVIAFLGIGAIVLGLGGVISSSLIKNRTVKRLLKLAFFILICVGIVCASPIILLYLEFNIALIFAGILTASLIAIALGIFGVRISRELEHMVAKVLFRIIFIASIAAGSLLSVLMIIYFVAYG